MTMEILPEPTSNKLYGSASFRGEDQLGPSAISSVRRPSNRDSSFKNSVVSNTKNSSKEVHEYPFDLSKPLPLIKDQGRQVVPANYFFNNDLKYLKGGSLSSKYMNSTTKNKAAMYDTIEGIEDMVPSLWSPMKFYDGTHSSVRRVLHDIASCLEMDYLPKRRWSKLDRKRSHIMIKAIDRQLFERRLMRNLEKFVGGREYENDFRLLERTITASAAAKPCQGDSSEFYMISGRPRATSSVRRPSDRDSSFKNNVVSNTKNSSKKVHEYPFDLSKPLPLIKDQGRQVVPANYFFNNDLKYLKGGSLSNKYMTSTTKNKAATYDTIEGIEDMVPSLRCPMKLYKFVEGDFPRLNLRDIEDMLILLVQKKLSNLERDDLFDLNVALRMFTRCVVILKRVDDLQLGVKSYQKKLNITRHETFRSDITSMTPYTTYNNLQGTIYQEKFQRNRLMRLDELYKFCDGTLLSVRRVLHDIASSLEMDYLPKRRWNKLDRKRSRIMIKAIDR
ncbi:hypothetical protein Tco_1533366 [Tanacetum coccineum]